MAANDPLVDILALALGGAAGWWYLDRRGRASNGALASDTRFGTLVDLAPRPPSPAPKAEPPPVYVSDETEALGRVIASEAGDQSAEAQTLIAWTARNRARQKRTTIAALVCTPCGRQVGDKRPFSSRFAPTNAHRRVAARVLAAPQASDPTLGATHILEPGLMDRLYAKGKAEFDATAVRRRRLRTLDYYGSAHGWDFFGPKGGPGAKPVPEDWFDD